MRAIRRVAPPRESTSDSASSPIRHGPLWICASTSYQAGGRPVSRSMRWPTRSTMWASTCSIP